MAVDPYFTLNRSLSGFVDCCKGGTAQAGKPSCHQLQTTSESWSQLWQVPAIPGPKALNYKLKLQYKSRLSVLAPQHCAPKSLLLASAQNCTSLSLTLQAWC